MAGFVEGLAAGDTLQDAFKAGLAGAGASCLNMEGTVFTEEDFRRIYESIETISTGTFRR